MHQIFVTKFVSFVHIREIRDKIAIRGSRINESHECSAYANVQSPYYLERIQNKNIPVVMLTAKVHLEEEEKDEV